MRLILLTLLISIFSSRAKCDTIDYWHVYLNDSLIAEFNANSADKTIRLNRKELSSDDNLVVRYGTCMHCIDCHYSLEISLDIAEPKPSVESKEYFGKLAYPLDYLLNVNRKYDRTKFQFYCQVGISKGSYRTRVFELQLE